MLSDMATFFHKISKEKRRKIIRNLILLVSGIAANLAIHFFPAKNQELGNILSKLCAIYMLVTITMVCNSLLIGFLDIYSKTEKNRNHPLKGVIQGLQVVLFFVGGILIVATVLDKSPTVLLTGLGASAAVLMLIFKDSILGLVAGVQLSQNNMVQLGDWIQMPDGSANGTIEEITLNTVKVRNWDNTITMIPPYTLVSSPFKNWRGMVESKGRRVDKKIHLDMTTIKILSEENLDTIRRHVPLLNDFRPSEDSMMSNSQLFRTYIERYLRSHPVVAQDLDLIIAQREPSELGLPIEIYFFLSDKVWSEYEKIQSDIFDHILVMAPMFYLKPYQLRR